MAKELTIVQQKAVTIREYIHQPHIVKQIEAALPSFLNADSFLRTFYTAMLRNAALLDCTKESMLSALIESAQLGLPPMLRKAALVPYGKEVQFQPMYGGLMELGRRTEKIKITGHVVYEKDDFDLAHGTDDHLHHVPCMEEDPGDMIGSYTVWTFDSGMQTFLFMPAHQIFKVRAVSQAWKRAQREPKNAKAQETPWVQWPDQMWIKTVIKRHSKLQPCSIEMERAVQLDDRVEMGLSQSDMLGKFDGFGPTGPAPKTEPEGKAPDQQLINKFNAMVKEQDDVDMSNLADYLKLSADTQKGTTIQDVKAFVVSKSGFTSFWDFYKSWEGYKSAKKAEPKEGKKSEGKKYSAFVQQFIHLRKGDREKTGLLAAILKNEAAIQAAPIEDQEAIRKKFHDVYGPDAGYPPDNKTEMPVETAENNNTGDVDQSEKPELSEKEKEAKILKFVDGSERDEAMGILVPCPNRDNDLIKVGSCDACLYNARAGCPTWTAFDGAG